MVVNYKKDLHHNYIVLPKLENCNEEAYCVSMLEANNIGGIIRPEPRIIDNVVVYYYDITSMQSIDTIYVKNTINYEELKSLFINLAEIVEQAYEYLLNENDLILETEHIYIELTSKKAAVCYLPGYNKDIGKQLMSLVEYLMNKVDYNDKEAVLYVYNIYAACRDEVFTFSNLLQVIRDSKEGDSNKSKRGKSISTSILKDNKQDISLNMGKVDDVKAEYMQGKQIPVMMEKVSQESEIYYYSLKTYIFTGACILGAIMLFLFFYNMKILNTSIGNRIDYGKLMALLLILSIVIGYLMKIIWNKNNRLTRIISKEEYIDPRVEYQLKPQAELKSDYKKKDYEYTPQKSKAEETCKPNNRIDSTVLLNPKENYYECRLEPEDKGAYGVIDITEVPFLIGKQESNVDYFLNKEVVSRYHVKITKEEEGYYITDLNSTNGTSLNGNPMSCYLRHKLTNGDKISIAGIDYIFNNN